MRVRRVEAVEVVLLVLVSLGTSLMGIGWGLPGEERSAFYPADPAWYEASQDSGRLYRTAPYESYHPDEGAILNALANMDVGRLSLNPHYFHYPSLWIYVTGAVLFGADAVGAVEARADKGFYVAEPDAMGRVYVVGRLVTAVFGAAGVVMLAMTGGLLFGRGVGFFGGLTLALMPLWARDAHFMMVSVPAATWMIATALLTVVGRQQGSRGWIWAAAVAAGLAASTRYPAGAAIALPLFALGTMTGVSRRKRWAGGGVCLLLFGLGFVAGTPYVLLAYEEFWGDVLFEAEDKLSLPGGWMVFDHLLTALGSWLTILFVVGLFVAVRRGREWRYQFVLLWMGVGLLQRLMSGADFMRYLMPALPALALLGGITLDESRRLLMRRGGSRWASAAAAAALLLPTALYTGDVLAVLRGEDVRNVAAGWLLEQVEPGQTIGVVGGLYYDMPPINAEVHDVVVLQPEGNELPTRFVVFTSETLRAASGAEPVLPGYEPTTFSQRPRAGWSWPARSRALDWGYTFLDVYVFSRR